jgi:putative peptidoglycan lipid II flippase
MLVGHEAVGVLFQRGAFTADDTARVAWVLLGFAPAIWAYQSIHILTRAFYALKQPMTPVRIAVSMVALNLLLNLTLIFTPLREAGLAWSTSICAMLQAAALARALARQVPGVVDRTVGASVLRTMLLASAMGAAVLAVGAVLPASAGTTQGMEEMVLALAAKVGAGALVYAGLAAILGMDELQWAAGRRLGFLRRLRR